MAKLDGELVVGCCVRMMDLVHPRKKDGVVFGRITYIHTETDQITAVVPLDLGHGYTVTCDTSKVEGWDWDNIPPGQKHFLRM